MTTKSRNWLDFADVDEEWTPDMWYWNCEIPMTSYAIILPADENRISANALQADNTVKGQWGMVDD